jgi:hypothetical protein
MFAREEVRQYAVDRRLITSQVSVIQTRPAVLVDLPRIGRWLQ